MSMTSSSPGHAHAPSQARHPARISLTLAIALTSIVMVVELIGGWWANSLSLISDAGHMLSDVLSLGMALFAVVMAQRPATARRTYGWHRVEILAALTNGIILVVIALLILMSAWSRLRHPEPVSGGVVLVVAGIGLVANLIGMRLLAHDRSCNVRSARLHLLGDALSSVGVLVAGAVIYLTGWLPIDAILSAVISVIILVGAFGILRETVDILLESTPPGVSHPDVACAIQAVEGVRGVHDLHIWSITSGMTALSGHVKVEHEALTRSDDVLNAVKAALRDQFGIEHTTIQLESLDYTEVGEFHT